MNVIAVVDFIHWDDGSGIDYELHQGIPVPRFVHFEKGRPVAQAAASAEHAAIVTNIGALLRDRLSAPARAYTGGGVADSMSGLNYYKPDVLVSCVGGRIPGWIVPDPVFIVEVLSPGTADFDESIKLADYCRMDSVQAVLLVDIRRPTARLVRRVGDHWQLDFLSAGDSVRVDALDLDLPMAEIYRGIEFTAADGSRSAGSGPRADDGA